MPFKSKAQLRACYAKKAQLQKIGVESTWDCSKWYHEGKVPFSKLPEYKNQANDSVFIGPRGGKFMIRNGRRVYV